MFDLCSQFIEGSTCVQKVCSTIIVQVFPQVINKFVDVFQQMLARVNKRSTSFPHVLTQYSAGAQQVYSKRFPKVLIECYDDQQKFRKVFFTVRKVHNECSTFVLCEKFLEVFH